MAAKLKEVKTSLMIRRHWPIEMQGRWLGSVVRGHLAYYSVPGNIQQVTAFRDEVIRHWRAALRRRSQKTRMNWQRMRRHADRWIPPVHYTHSWPNQRLAARTQVGAQCVRRARWDLAGGGQQRTVPSAIERLDVSNIGGRARGCGRPLRR